MIEKNKEYRIKGTHAYFKEKYGTDNPIIRIECLDTEAWPGSNYLERAMMGNWAAALFLNRMTQERGGEIPKYDDRVWYGHIGHLGECVAEDELEEI